MFPVMLITPIIDINIPRAEVIIYVGINPPKKNKKCADQSRRTKNASLDAATHFHL